MKYGDFNNAATPAGLPNWSGDHSMLQPVAAYPCFVVGMIQVEVKKEAGRKELELLGQSSGARVAAGGNDWAQGGEQAT